MTYFPIVYSTYVEILESTAQIHLTINCDLYCRAPTNGVNAAQSMKLPSGVFLLQGFTWMKTSYMQGQKFLVKFTL